MIEDTDYGSIRMKPFYARRWWLRTRKCTPNVYFRGVDVTPFEFYVPMWAFAFEKLHQLVFGKSNPVETRFE